MKNLFKPIILFLFIIFSTSGLFSQTVDQKLLVVQNDNTVGGSFVVAIQVKGTSLPAANTLGSATIDVQFDNTKLNYLNAGSWAFGGGDGYSRTATNNTTFIRVGVLGTTVGPSQGTVGFDIVNSSTYTTWVQLNFQISSSGTSSLTIDPGTNQIGLFQNHANDPDTGVTGGVINNQTLSTPVNITDEPLPAELNAFNANVNGNNVELLWKTATEVNNNGFEIQRKANSQNSKWVKVSFVQGHGNSNSPNEYSYTDKNLTGGTKYVYRLKQIDIDGQFQYSKEVEVEVVPRQYALYQNYPNPFNPSTYIKFDLPEASKVRLDVYNILGEKVKTLLNQTVEAGFHQIQFNGSNLASGTYIYRIEVSNSGQNFIQTKKMLLIK